jgi:hypothetical protein
MERTECFGYCPAYVVEVHPDGNVSYTGNDYVRVRGPAHWKIPKADADALFDRAACANPGAWKANYTFRVTDNPTAIVTVDLDTVGHAVVVKDYPPCHSEAEATPDSLCELEKAIDELARTSAYVECPSPDGGLTFCTR